ncbi:hypothetical protein [Nesterenkonia sp. NBAIMH1]|uniref:hypothetical protein n=1 Tax=Nesterenkonia sp. NBAIMH1 TaxID=2600320 RepID=UPI0011B5D3B4|nr:hypothetical protein [Nesterenkonia sp. NBAIMH1]
MDVPTVSLEEAVAKRESYEAQAEDAQDELAEAEETLESTSGEVSDDDVHVELSARIEELNEALNTEPDDTNGESFEALTLEVSGAVDEVLEALESVSESHDAWTQAERERKEAERQAEEEEAQTDPANYGSPSDREWALVERDPDSYMGEKYVLYGHVTQADAATGNISIRVNTGPAREYRRYNYDVNTVVVTGRDDVFSDVVKDDHVKMLVEVGGAFRYDTAIGGSTTAVMATAFDVEVIGQF